MNTKTYNRRRISSSQKGFENVAEGTRYDDYHINTNGMGILDAENIIEEIEGRGNQAVLTVQTSDGSTNHSQFGSKDWKEYKDSVNDSGNAITDVWVTEVEGGSYVRNSRRPVNSSKYYIEYYAGGTDNGYVSYDNNATIDLDNAMTFDSEQEANEWKDEHNDEWKATLKVVPYPDYNEIESSHRPVKLSQALFSGNYNNDTINLNKNSITDMPEWLYDKYENGRSEWKWLIDAISNHKWKSGFKGNSLYFTDGNIDVIVGENQARFKVYKITPDIKRIAEDLPYSYNGKDENDVTDVVIQKRDIEQFIKDLLNDYVYKRTYSSRQIKSARYIATDPETGEVLGSADTYEEAVNEWGEDVTITDSEAAEGQQEEEGLFSSYEEEIEEDDMEIESSKKPSGDKAFLSNIVSSFASGSMTEEQAVKRIALRINCNQAFARNILSSAMEDSTLIQSGTMEIAEDLNKDFNIDGDIESWSEDYVPQAGKANTIGGEILRATAQIVNRFYNDGDKIGIGNGKETVNPAARYIIENAVELTEVPDELQDMLNNNSDINFSDESYEEWVDDFKYAIEDYLRNHEELFRSPNKVDMWDFKGVSDTKVAIDDIFIEDEDGSKYFFQGGPEGWHCYDIYYANNPKYNIGDVVNSGDIKAAGGDTDEEFVTFSIDGFTYSAELYDNDEYEITDIDFDGQLVHKDEEWTTEDFERYQIYDSSNNSELSIEDLY